MGKRSFAWVTEPDPAQAAKTPLLTQLRGDVERDLLAKGYVKAPREQADFLVEVLVRLGLDTGGGTVAADKLVLQEAWDSWGGGMGSSFSQRMTESATIIDARLGVVATDPKDLKTPLWRGMVSLVMNLDTPDPAKPREAAARLMREFPASKAAKS